MILKTLRKLTAAVALGLAAFSLAIPAVALAQEATDAPATEADATPAKKDDGHAAHGKDKTLWDYYRLGGWVMHFLLAGSVCMVWLTVDGFIKTSNGKVYPATSVEALRNFFRAGDYVGAYNFAKTHPSPICDVVRAGVAYASDGKTMTEEAMLSELDRVKAGFDARISYLSVIGVCSPMVGLTGTVTGMMGAFSALGSSGAGDTGALAAHIGEVLVATGSGLFVAIPAFVTYYLLRNRVTKMMHDLQELAASLFRNMPYEDLAGAHIGDEEIYAAKPVLGAEGLPAAGESTPAA